MLGFVGFFPPTCLDPRRIDKPFRQKAIPDAAASTSVLSQPEPPKHAAVRASGCRECLTAVSTRAPHRDTWRGVRAGDTWDRAALSGSRASGRSVKAKEH